MSHQIAAGIGEVIGVAKTNSEQLEPKFFVLLPSSLGWESSVWIENSYTNIEMYVLIDYDNLSIRCKSYLKVSHYVRDCPLRSNTQTTTH